MKDVFSKISTMQNFSKKKFIWGKNDNYEKYWKFYANLRRKMEIIYLLTIHNRLISPFFPISISVQFCIKINFYSVKEHIFYDRFRTFLLRKCENLFSFNFKFRLASLFDWMVSKLPLTNFSFLLIFVRFSWVGNIAK